MNNKTVSVHIVTFNSADDIIDCLTAVLAQDYPVKQIVVVDNASTDGCVDRVKEFYQKIEEAGVPSLVLIENVINTGFAPPITRPWRQRIQIMYSCLTRI